MKGMYIYIKKENKKKCKTIFIKVYEKMKMQLKSLKNTNLICIVKYLNMKQMRTSVLLIPKYWRRCPDVKLQVNMPILR